MVRSLILPETLPWTYLTSSWEIYKFRESVSIALKAITNLTALTIRPKPYSYRFHAYLDLWMLEGCKFRLRTLHNEGDTLYYPGRSPDFFLQQSELRDWMPGRLGIGYELHMLPNLFPNLSTAHFRDPKICSILGPRPLQCVSVDTTNRGMTKDEAIQIFDDLSRSAQSLVELRFVTEGSPTTPGTSGWWSSMDIIEIIGDRLPNLRTLSYHEIIRKFHVSYPLFSRWLLLEVVKIYRNRGQTMNPPSLYLS
jgi:hypothetical protein